MISQEMKRYLPEEVPDYLFTQNKLNRMGLATTSEHVAYVYYPEQKREYKLFDINNTRKCKQQTGFSLVVKDMTVEQVLKERRRELKLRKNQLG
ncbi:hypothetical protein [Metabacillus sp. B2-18]|uniref:hypothetical protein n=1 Tax=Metabacillus sp. B2-18 TaxID=2897333 RepID=UPI001E506AF2|nr:hypothetical protein [Metabacillus sp. B2-18]UGB29959.1 hypothetical protein LPC09_19905 [Metabacillus sp. B2-18]